MCVCVCVCVVLYNNIFILPVSFALLSLSILVFALFPSFPFAVMGYLLIFLRCLCVNSFFSLRCEEYSKRLPTSNNVTSASIILPVTCCCVGHKNALQTHNGGCVCLRVCVRALLLTRRAAAERVSLWAGFLGQTSACGLDKHQSKWLCSEGLASDRKTAPRPPAPAHPRQSQYFWP